MNRENDTVCWAVKAGLCGLIPAFTLAFMVVISDSSVVWAQGAEEAADWEEARCGYPEEMRRFIKKHPDSEYRGKAEACLERARDEQLSLLLADCAVHLEAGRLTEGTGGNAYDCYEEALALESGNVMALTGLKEIEDRYIEWVRRDMESGDLAGAGRYLKKVLGLNPGRGEALELERMLERERTAEKAGKEAASLLAECAAHLEASRLTEGARGNAYDCYEEVLTLDSGNEVALSGFKEIEDKYIEWVRRDIGSGEWARAGRFLEKVRGLNPEREEVLELERLLKEAEEASAIAERERQAAEEAERERRAAEEADRERQVGREFRDCAGCPEMVVVPSGSFRMGSPSSESERDDNEGPRHRVRISQPFAVGVYEVTRGEFSQFISETGYSTGYSTGDSCWIWEGDDWDDRSGRTWRSPGFSQSDREPVVCVSWNDAKEYAGWLSAKTGYDYRLLSESEWEYVARAGTETEFHTGRRITTDQANFNGKHTYNGSSEGVYRRETVSVGSFPGNDFGLHDVHGNVWEWVEDCWNGSYDGAPTDGSAWISGACQYRVLRGGSWNYLPGDLRSANRNWDSVGIRNYDLGFRIARTLTP